MPPSPAPGAALVALTQDAKLIEALSRVADSVHPLTTVGSEVDLGSALIARHTGVALLDAAALATPIEQLATRLIAQFPDLVLVAAGGIDDQGALANLIADGSVHRFLHKPVSEQRVKLFVGACWRRHAELLAGARAQAAAPAAAARGAGRKWLAVLVLVGLAAVAAPLAWRPWQTLPSATLPPPAPTPAPTSAAAPADSALEAILTRADQALAAGALVAPAGNNAAELYRAALERSARDPRAVHGLQAVVDRLLEGAEAQLHDQHLDAAQQLCDAARAVSPEHPRVAFVAAQISAQRERAVLAQAQRAAAGGDFSGALAVLDHATRGTQPSSLVSEARVQLARQQVDARALDFLKRAREALAHGHLIEPTEQNARFFIESAHALAPDNPEVVAARQDLLARLLAQGNQAIAAGNADRAEYWAAAAAEAGAERSRVNLLKADAQRLRSAAAADALARLASLFNQRLAQGRLVEPANDSARFYLTQLEQADPAHPSTQLARAALGARLLEEARSALHAQDPELARRRLSDARTVGADGATLAALDAQLGAAAPAMPAPDPLVSASTLMQTHYVAPQYPPAARARSLGGWVDVQFTVTTEGAVADATIVGAEPVGLFESSALEAVRRWRYQPVIIDGHPLSERARVRVLFELQR